MIKDKVFNYGLNFIKKNVLPSDSTPKFESKKIRDRYYRIRNQKNKQDILSNMKLDRPILMIGVPHSGTSVLASIFSNHPDIAMWTEASEVWEPYWAEGVDSEYNRLIPKYEKDVGEIDILRITEAFSKFVQSQSKTRLLNKNPRNTVRISFMRKIFPDAKIIHIFRDGRDVVNSISRNMPDFMIEQICDRWTNTLHEVKVQSKSLPSTDYVEIKYEEFCENPKEFVLDTYEKFDLKITDKIRNKLPTKLPNFNGLWKKQMNQKYHELMVKKLQPTMREWGYNC